MPVVASAMRPPQQALQRPFSLVTRQSSHSCLLEGCQITISLSVPAAGSAFAGIGTASICAWKPLKTPSGRGQIELCPTIATVGVEGPTVYTGVLHWVVLITTLFWYAASWCMNALTICAEFEASGAAAGSCAL